MIFISYRQRPDYPLILLANRDEFYERPTARAAYWEDHPDILAGRDLIARGTWLGVTRGGRFAAVTNFREPDGPRGDISRGDLVADFLKTDAPAGRYLEDVRQRADRYSGFNLLAGEINEHRNEIFYYSNRGGGILELERGLYGLSNHLLDTPWPKVVRGKEALNGLLAGNAFDRERFFGLLADRTQAPDEELPDTGVGPELERLLSPVFIRTPVYGTRCSTVLTIDGNFGIELEERVFGAEAGEVSG